MPLLPEPTMQHPAPRIEPLSEKPVPSALQSQAEMSTRPQREMLAALASELSTRPPPPRPVSATLAGGRTTSTADENLALMAHRLEVVLHKPNLVADADLPAKPTRAASSLAQYSAVKAEAMAPVRVLPPSEPQRSDAKPKQSTIPVNSLERQLASSLGRSTRH